MMLRKKSRENLKMFWMLWDYGFVKYFIFIFTVPVLPAGMEEWYLNPHGSSTKLLSVAACGALLRSATFPHCRESGQRG